MRKYGKFERMPDGTRAKQPAVKGVLLQTYLTSLLCIVLCVTMFFGTTYAWFTSEVNNTGNEIYIGILDVALKMQVPDSDGDGEPDYVSLSATTNGINDTKLYTDAIHWEPGYTSLRTVQVENQGDLAFDYALSFTDGQMEGKTNAALLAAAQWFDVWVFDHQNGTYQAPAAYADVKVENGWKKIGSLADALKGTVVFHGTMSQTDVQDKAPAKAHTYTIALHMTGEEAENEQQAELNALMGQTIGLNVKLVASQLGSQEEFANADA